MSLSHSQQDVLGRIDKRIQLVEAALERAFRDGGTAALAADLRFLRVAEVTIEGRPLEEIGERIAHRLTRKLRTFRRALERAVAELGDQETS